MTPFLNVEYKHSMIAIVLRPKINLPAKDNLFPVYAYPIYLMVKWMSEFGAPYQSGINFGTSFTFGSSVFR